MAINHRGRLGASVLYTVVGDSAAGGTGRRNEDAFGMNALPDALATWVIDGASPLPPATNAEVSEFARLCSAFFQRRLAHGVALAPVVRGTGRYITAHHSAFARRCLALPKYARPLASGILVRVGLERGGLTLSYASFGDCAIIIDVNGTSLSFVRRSRSERDMVRFSHLLKRPRASAAAHEVRAYQKHRRLRQMRDDYRRWLTLDPAGPKRMVSRRFRCPADAAVSILICSDGFYSAFLQQGYSFQRLLAETRALGIGVMLRRLRELEALTSVDTRLNRHDDATAVLVQCRSTRG
jgi:hypothetical protein